MTDLLLDPNPEDLLAPPFFSDNRRSSILVASFNLLATIVGGGILSLPLVFEKCGVVPATLLLLLAALVTNFSLQQLCLSSRRTGASSYGEVARTAFGDWMEYSVSCLLFIFLLFVLVAYMVLIRDIWTPVIVAVSGTTEMKLITTNPNVVLLILLVILSPFLIQKSLYALRFNCYIGFSSVCILCLVLCYRGVTHPAGQNAGPREIQYFKIPTVADILFAFPITMLSFCCHFNIVAIQEALVRPSRQRMSRVIDSSLTAAFALNLLFGLGGYLYAGSDVEGNILRNTPTMVDDWAFLVGRIGVGTTLFFATPMVLLPCRESLLEIIDSSWWQTPDEVEEQRIGERTSLLRHDPIQLDRVFQNPYMHYGSTLLIVVVCYIGAVAARGVAIVWSLCGCSMGFLISFILPSACFIAIEKQQVGSRLVSYEKPAWVALGW
eukprot:CAMPEP_0168728308 /NCGR_PEP_ID=MMETSP0724-20121128/5617_1 /TAXON_ID=265536 /ORGANISM="Amphiprora sp., Strain CCMP467" /LENGTH=436 /DNA_ID=CAMNT_0008775149 /DNA_START=65 /DNA_END=1372 /DNA_ORIENTATION=+